MKLLLSALLLAVLPAAFAQNPSDNANQKAGQQARGSGHYVGDLWAHPAPKQLLSNACPLTLTSAQLDWPGSYLPVTSADKVMEPSLALRFQNASGKAIRSVSVTAELRVKKDVYALDATPVELRLSFAGTKDLDKELSQLATIPLPKGLHEYGVVQVRLDQVMFANGSFWMAAASRNPCAVNGNGLIAAR
jgi:hypothetical protein